MSFFDNNIVPFPMVPRGYLKYLVLKLISYRPKHGYEIMDEIERITRGYWRPSPGSIYPLLSSLEKDMCIEKEKRDKPKIEKKTRGKKRKKYRITEKGLEELNQYIKELDKSETFKPCCLPSWLNVIKGILEIDTFSNSQKTTRPTKIKGEEKSDQINYCPYCGIEIKHPNSNFCPNCGSKIALKI